MTRRAGRPKATTHEAIRAVAMALFLERGYGKTSMSDVAEAVGIGRSTLFDYYPSKASLFFGKWGHLEASLQALLDDRPADEPLRESIRAAIHFVFGSPDRDHGPLIKRLEMMHSHSDLAAGWALNVRDVRVLLRTYLGQRLGCLPDDFVPAIYVDTLLAAGESAMEHCARGRSRWSFDETLDRAIEPVLDAIPRYRVR